MRDEMVCREDGIIESIHTHLSGKLIQIENDLRRDEALRTASPGKADSN